MNNLFQKTSAYWAKYSEYEYRRGEDGLLYLMPSPTAVPSVYDPLANAEALVLDAVNVGRLAMKQDVEERTLRDAVLDFVSQYGLLGFMTALPTTPRFIDYDAVYLPKNHFLKEESMATLAYLDIFFPFKKLDFHKGEEKIEWNVRAEPHADRRVLALTMTFQTEPMAMAMGLQPEYAERFDWLVTQFQDLAFSLVSSHLFYEQIDTADDNTLNLYQQGMAAFGSIAPTYHIGLYRDKPRIVWEFHSLLRGIQMMFSFALTDETRPLRLCKRCGMAFTSGRPNAAFCSPKCKNQHNVYKNRGSKKSPKERNTDSE